MKLEQAQAAFQSILDGLDKSGDSIEFLQWIRDCFTTEKCDETTEADFTLLQIVSDLKNMIPVQGILADEKIVWPRAGVDSDCDPKTTVHVDGFLNGSDADIDDLCDSGAISRNYCLDCGSHRTKPLTFISHSTSVPQIKFIFSELVPNLTGKNVLDIGSRLGPLLYAAYQYSNCKKIIGIEISDQLCQIQTTIVQKYAMQDRIEIIHGDIRDHIDAFNAADVIFMNNTFQFFMLTADQIEIWQKLYENSRTGQIIITIPSIQEMTDHLALPFNVASWVSEIPTEHLLLKHSNNLDIFSDLQKIHLQEIKK